MGERSFYTCDSVTHEGKSNTWFTPKYILDGLGSFDLDPCTETTRPFDTATVHYCADQGSDGLALEWFGRVWLNPPYGKSTELWLDRLAEHGNGVAIVYSALETRWGQRHLQACDKCFFLKSRVSFLDRHKKKRNNAGKGSVLLCYGDQEISLRGIGMVLAEGEIL